MDILHMIANIEADDMEEHEEFIKKWARPTKRFHKIPACEDIIKRYSAPTIIHHPIPGRIDASYIWDKDTIYLPLPRVVGKHYFYTSFFHELAHSTGTHNRLNRAGTIEWWSLTGRIEEEVLAEVSSMMLCQQAGILEHTRDRSLEYIAIIVRKYKLPTEQLTQALDGAAVAVDFILNY